MGHAQRVIDEVLQPGRVANLPASPAIKRFDWRECVDSTGQDALDITAVVDGEPDLDAMRQQRFLVFDAILHALADAGVDLYPYVWLRTESDLSEQSALLAGSADEEAEEA